MQINRKSWHWKLIRLMGDPWVEYRVTDSCQYVKYFLRSCLLIIISACAVVVVAALALNGVYHLLGMLFGFLPDAEPELAAVGSMVLISPLILYSVYLYANRKCRTKKSGFVSQAIDRIKNKYCSKIEFLD